VFCFLLFKADMQANPWIFSDSAQALTNNPQKFLIFIRHLYALLSVMG
jgi:hypothetical protein